MTIPLLTVDDERTQFNFDRLAALVAGAAPRIVSGGKKNIPGSESTTSTTYTTLTTPDTVTIALPTDGLVAVWYQALWQDTVASNGKAAIFVGSNQLVTAPTAGGATVVQEVTTTAGTNVDGYLHTSAHGLDDTTNAAGSAEVTTGQVIGDTVGRGGPVYIFAAAGTYDISIKFKNNAAGTLTASKRHLWVAAYSFA